MSLASEYAKLRQKRNVDATPDTVTAGSASLPAAGDQSGNQTFAQIYGQLRKNRTSATTQEKPSKPQTVTVEQLLKMGPDGFKKTTNYLSKTITEKEAELTKLQGLITSTSESRSRNQQFGKSKYHTILQNTSNSLLQENLQKYQQVYKEYEDLISQYNGYITAYNQWDSDSRRMTAIENDMEEISQQLQETSSDLPNESSDKEQEARRRELQGKYNLLSGEYAWTKLKEESNWYKKYQGLNYSEIGEILMSDPSVSYEERRWALDYGKTIKTAEDVDKQIAAYSDMVAQQEELLEFQKYKNLYEAIQNGLTTDFTPTNIPYPEGTAEYWQEYSRQEQAYNAQIVQKYNSYLQKYGSEESIKQAVKALEREKEFITKYRDVYKNADFSEKSQYQPLKDDGVWEFPLYDAINGDADAEEYITKTAAGYVKIGDAYVKHGGTSAFNEVYHSISDVHQMTKDEISLFNYLYHTEGQASAQTYFEHLRPDLLARQRGEQETKAAAYAEEHPWLSSIGTILASPAKITTFAGQLADYLDDGSIDKNASYNRFVYESNAARQAVSAKIAEGNWGEAGSFLYNTAMSMGDFLLSTAVSGGNSAIAMTVMSTGAAADTTLDALDRGLDSDDAILLGSIAGIAEAVTEKISIDALLNKSGMGKSALGYILQNTIAEGGEEGVSGIINLFADVIISKDKSQWEQSIQAYQDAGDDEKTAFWKAVRDQATQIGLDVLGGALSGNTMGGVSAMISAAGAYDTGRKLNKSGITSANGPELIAAGLKGDPNGRAYFLAMEMQAKLDAGEKLTKYDIGRLVQANRAEGLEMQVTPGLQGDEQSNASPSALGNDAVDAGAKPQSISDVIRMQIPGQNETATQGGNVQLQNPQVNATPDMIQQAKRLSAVTGRKIVFFTEMATGDSIVDGYHENGVLYINTESQNPTAVNVGHELTHSIVQSNQWGQLRQLVLNRIESTGGNLEQQRQAKRDWYAKNGVQLSTQEQIDEEIVASYVSQYLLTDTQSIENLVHQNPSVGQKIMGWVNNLLAKLGNKNAQEAVFLRNARDLYATALKNTQSSFTEQTGNYTPSSQTAQPVTAEGVDVMTPAQMRQWANQAYAAGQISEETLNQMLEDIDAQEELENGEMDPEKELKRLGMGDGQFSISPTFGAEIDAWDGKTEKTFYVGNTSDALQSIGVKDSGIVWHSGKINKIMQKHTAMTKEIIKQVPEILEHPVAVLSSKQSDSRLVIFGTVTDRNGDPVTAILELQPTTRGGQLLDMTVIASAYGKEGDVAHFVESSGVVYLDPNRNRTENWMQGLGLQLPSDTTVLGSIGSVSYPNGKVKIESVPYSQHMQSDARNTNDQRQYSVSESKVDKAGVISDLRAILQKGGDPSALRQYIADLERNAGNAEQNPISAERNTLNAYQNPETAQEILAAAREMELSVEEYLEMNWERYDVDGQWNDAARQALRMEESGSRQYSISENNPLDSNGAGGVNLTSRNTKEGDTSYDEGRIQTGDAKSPGSNDKGAGISDVRSGDRVDSRTDATGKAWRDLSRRNQAIFRRQVESTINNSSNYDEIRTYLALRIGKQVQDMSLADKNAAIDSLAEQLYSDLVNGDNLVITENKWSLLGNLRTLLETVKQIQSTQKSKRQYSVSQSTAGEDLTEEQTAENGVPESTETTETGKAQNVAGDGNVRETLPRKAERYLKRAEQTLLNKLSQNLSVPWFARRNFLQPMVEEISEEYLRNGTVSQETVDRLFDKAYEEGVVVDREFYDQYVELKKFLQKNPVTLNERNRADIADFDDFKKRNRYALRIKDEGGLPVDSAYRELQEMAPELFPKDITHPADQLVRMADVSNSIRIAEKSLQDYYKHDPDFKAWAKNDFGASVNEIASELKKVKRYVDDRMAEDSAPAPETAEEALAVYDKLKVARRNYEKVAAKNLLTKEDESQLGRLLRGEIELQHLDPDNYNVAGITAVYEAKVEYADLLQQITAYKRKLHANLRKTADGYLKTANEWKDKRVGLAYMRETMVRNIEDIVPDAKLAKKINQAYFETVAVSEAAATRMKKDFRKRVESLDLSRKVKNGDAVSEAHAVQLLGEAMDNIRIIEKSRGRIKERDGKKLSDWQGVVSALWTENPGLDKTKIQNAVQEFRKIYDELFREMNKVRVENGYEPVNYRSGYFPHFQPGDGDGILAQFGKALGINTQIEALPTTINGLTHTFKPGITWFGNAQERLGFNTAYDAVEGFDRYIEGVASVIHQTGNIQNLRALASQVRYRTSEPGIQEQVDEIRADNRLTEEEKQAGINALYEKGRFTLSNFVTELDEYTNLLANKKSRLDRTIEALLGRRFYTLMKQFESRVGANMVGGNLGSAITNFIPLVQANAQMDRFALLNGMWETLKAYKSGDGLVDMSDFLTNRRGSDPLVKNWLQMASNVAGKPMEYIDCFAADSIVRGAYYQNIKRGMTPEDAMHQADLFAARVMADRSKGATPTLFSSVNPVFKAFTQFQLEVNNQFSEVFKDLPRGFREKGMAALIMVFLKYFIGAWIFNDLYEAVVGRRPALDPIGLLNEAAGDFAGYEMPNLFEMGGDLLAGKEINFKTERKTFGDATKSLFNSMLSELPFSSALTLLGADVDGGRIPVSSAIPDLSVLWQAATDEKWGDEKRWKELGDEMWKLAYVALPFGGNQISKVAKGIAAAVAGGSYSVDSEGNEILQYPIYDDIGSIIRAAIMGKSATKEAQDWVENGFDSLNAKQTAAYKDMIAAGVDPRDAFSLLKDWKNLGTLPGEGTDDQRRRELLINSDISAEGKKVMVGMMLGTEMETDSGKPSQYAKFLSVLETGMDVDDYLQFRNENGDVDKYLDLHSLGMPASEAADYAVALADLEPLAGKKQVTDTQRRDLLLKSGFSEKGKIAAIGEMLGTEMNTDSGNPTQYAKFLDAIDSGMDVDEYLRFRNEGGDIDNYLKFKDAGLSNEHAMELSVNLEDLEPIEGEEKVITIQRLQAAVDSSDDPKEQLTALASMMQDSQYKKVESAYSYGVKPTTYVHLMAIRPDFDANGNGSYSQAEIEAAIDALDEGYKNPLLALKGEAVTLTIKQKAILWQLLTGAKSAKNNPYSVTYGQQVLDSAKS